MSSLTIIDLHELERISGGQSVKTPQRPAHPSKEYNTARDVPGSSAGRMESPSSVPARQKQIARPFSGQK
jgi:hypothetical protein